MRKVSYFDHQMVLGTAGCLGMFFLILFLLVNSTIWDLMIKKNISGSPVNELFLISFFFGALGIVAAIAWGLTTVDGSIVFANSMFALSLIAFAISGALGGISAIFKSFEVIFYPAIAIGALAGISYLLNLKKMLNVSYVLYFVAAFVIMFSVVLAQIFGFPVAMGMSGIFFLVFAGCGVANAFSEIKDGEPSNLPAKERLIFLLGTQLIVIICPILLTAWKLLS